MAQQPFPFDADAPGVVWPWHQWIEDKDGTLLLWLAFDRSDRPFPDGGHRYFGLYWRGFHTLGETTEAMDIPGIVAEWVEQGLAGSGAGALTPAEDDEVREAAAWLVPYIEQSLAGLANMMGTMVVAD